MHLACYQSNQFLGPSKT